MVRNFEDYLNLFSIYYFLVPENSPSDLNVELESTTSLSIKWEPPPFNKINGIILGYKVNINFLVRFHFTITNKLDVADKLRR